MFWWEPRLIVGAQLERVSWAARCICCDLHSGMWWHHKAWCQWMERKYRGRHSKKDDAWVSSWKQEERKWMKDDMVTYSKCLRQRMRKTWTLPLQFFVREWILSSKKKIAVIAWAHTEEQWRRDRTLQATRSFLITCHCFWVLIYKLVFSRTRPEMPSFLWFLYRVINCVLCFAINLFINNVFQFYVPYAYVETHMHANYLFLANSCNKQIWITSY